MRWAVEIQNTNLSTRMLSELLSSIGYSLSEGIEHLALTSSEINDCQNAQEVFELAKKVRSVLTGPINADQGFVLGAVIDFSIAPPKRIHFLEAECCEQSNDSFSAVISQLPPKGLTPQEIEQWHLDLQETQYQIELENIRSKLIPAYSNPNVLEVFKLLSVEKPSGEIVYKIYELMEGHPNNRLEFHSKFNISSTQFKRFKEPVHNPTVSGDWARHAYHDKPKISNPMSKDEAESFVRDIADKWIKSFNNS